MTTSAARPDSLDDYASHGRALTAGWATKIAELTAALDAARAALHRDLPAGFVPTEPDLATPLRELSDDLDHLDRWVAGVAVAFRAADGGRVGSGAMSIVDDRSLAVGSPIAPQKRARADADALAALLKVPLTITGEPLSPAERKRWTSAVEALTRVATQIGSGPGDLDYAAALYNDLGPVGTRAVLDLVNQLGLAADRGVIDGEQAFAGIVEPLARALGDADRSGHLDRSIVTTLLDLGAGADTESPAYTSLGLQGQLDADIARDMRRRSLAIVLATGQLSSETAAAAASAVLTTAAAEPESHDREGFSGTFGLDHPDFALSEMLALRGLLGNDHAVELYLRDRTDHPMGTNLAVLVAPSQVQLDGARGLHRGGPTIAAMTAGYNQLRADVLERGLVTLPVQHDEFADPAMAALAAATIRTASAATKAGPLDPLVQRALALFVAPWAQDIASLAAGSTTPVPASRITDVTGHQLDGFLTAVSNDAVARHLLLAEGSALTRTLLTTYAAAIVTDKDDGFSIASSLLAGFFTAVVDAARRAGGNLADERAAAVHLLGVAITPLLDLVGYSVIPAGGVAATVARAAGHSQLGTIAEWIADHLVAKVEVGSIVEAGAEVTGAFASAAFDALFANDVARVALGGPASIAGMPPIVLAAVRKDFMRPPDRDHPGDAPPAAARVATLAAAFDSLFQSSVAFNEVAERSDGNKNVRTP